MSDSLSVQALRLDFGDEFDDTWARTESYVKGLIGKPWWVSKKQLLNCEGPLGRMVEHCMVYQLEHLDRIKGYKAYTKYLTKEYGTSLKRNWLYIGSLDNVAVAEAPVPSEDLTSSEHDRGNIPDWITEEQADFLTMYAKMGMAQTADMLGITNKRAWNMRRIVQRKVRYHAAKDEG